MSHQLTISVSSPGILSSLKKVLNSIDGVSIVKCIKSKENDTTETILSDPETMASIKRGEEDLKNGRSKRMTSEEVRIFLGL